MGRCPLPEVEQKRARAGTTIQRRRVSRKDEAVSALPEGREPEAEEDLVSRNDSAVCLGVDMDVTLAPAKVKIGMLIDGISYSANPLLLQLLCPSQEIISNQAANHNT